MADEGTHTSERFVMFTDAVVAIAMTLLILPLMESVGEASRAELRVGEYLAEHESELVAFAISFAVIAAFWMLHHWIMRPATPMNGPRSLVNLAWMMTIVALPVATALSGGLDSDRLLIAVYVGTMALSSWLLTLLAGLENAARRRAGQPGPGRSLIAGPLAMAVLYTVALLIGVLQPAVGYYPLFGLALTPVLRIALLRTVLRS